MFGKKIANTVHRFGTKLQGHVHRFGTKYNSQLRRIENTLHTINSVPLPPSVSVVSKPAESLVSAVRKSAPRKKSSIEK